MKVIAECAENLNSGAIITVENTRYRVRQLPIEQQN